MRHVPMLLDCRTTPPPRHTSVQMPLKPYEYLADIPSRPKLSHRISHAVILTSTHEWSTIQGSLR